MEQGMLCMNWTLLPIESAVWVCALWLSLSSVLVWSEADHWVCLTSWGEAPVLAWVIQCLHLPLGHLVGGRKKVICNWEMPVLGL